MNATQWLEVVASFSSQVLGVIVVCTVLERFLIKSTDRSAIWGSCFFCVLLLGCSALILPRLHLIQPWSLLGPQALVTVSSAQNVIGRLLLATWSLGACVSLVLWIARSLKLRSLLRNCDELPARELQRILGEELVKSEGLDKLTVLVCDEFDGPFCRHLHQPTIVLPLFLLEGDRDDLRHVVLHELEHLSTDHAWQLFWQQLVQVVCWFHPAVWKAASRASLMREFACDEAASKCGLDTAAYLRTLLHIAERCESKRLSSSIGFARTPSQIALRARRLVELAKRNRTAGSGRGIGRRFAVCILFVTAIILSFVSVPSDPLASPRSAWSPWPRWTAKTAHCFGFKLRDFEQFDRRSQIYEVLLEAKKK